MPPSVTKRHTGGGSGRAPRLDAMNLTGITALMNLQHVKPGANLDAAEANVMGKNRTGGQAQRAAPDPVGIYNAELSNLAQELGITIDEDFGAPPPKSGGGAGGGADKPAAASKAPAAKPVVPAFDINSLIEDVDLSRRQSQSEISYSSRGSSSRSSGSSYESYSTQSSSRSGSGSSYSGSTVASSYVSTESEDNHAVNEIIGKLETDLGIKTRGDRHRRRLRATDVPVVERHRRHAEEDPRAHINSVVQDLRGETQTSYGAEQGRAAEDTASKLEQIGQLIVALEEDGIDCKRIKIPTADSPPDEINKTLRTLMLKNDMNRYSSIAEEVIIGAAEAFESVFDGSWSVPLLGRLDYTGYPATVNAKLHRMRFETSQIVGRIVEDHNISPKWRILMELLPSFVLYPRQQRKQRGSPGLAGDLRVNDARMSYAAIRGAEEGRHIQDVQNL